MQKYSGISVIIPSYDPDEKLAATVAGVIDAGFSDVVVVNDGSAKDREKYFAEVAAMPQVTLLVHDVNRGKGAALKTAFAYLKENRPDSLGAVTADGDGQHLAKDICACVEKMLETGECVLGARDFNQPGIPERSLKGNRITQKVFKRFFGIEVSDTQTGLRVFPAKYYGELLATSGERYEYENNMLLTFRDKKMPFSEVKIETVYIDENAASHFRPVRDSARIYYRLFERIIKYTASSVFCTVVENVLQTVLHDLLSGRIASRMVLELFDFLPARIISALLNYCINRKFVFKEKQRTGSMGRYAVLWVSQAALTWLCITGVESLTGGTGGIVYFLLISLVKTVIFFVSYKVQKKWVFKT
ncbi:MAG: glycosyltransferase [Clostridia bacterium]|nr:glycosyltransferase [Clostridia bacterium]